MFKCLISSLLILTFGLSAVPIPVVRAETGPTVVINELMWMGSSMSAFDEWIELRNLTDQDIDLSLWRMTRKSGGTDAIMLTIPQGKIIPAQGFFLISNYDSSAPLSVLGIQPDLVDTNISLVNSALQIKLYNANNELLDVADDGAGTPLAGQYETGTSWKSMERVVLPGDGTTKESWRTASTGVNFDVGAKEFGTPRAPNGNSEPIVEAGSDLSAIVNESVLFDGSETVDPENDALFFEWDFGDKSSGQGVTPTHRYQAVGSYTVMLTVNDGELASSDSLVVTVKTTAPTSIPTVKPGDAINNLPPTSPKQNSNSSSDCGAGQTSVKKTGKLNLTELLPNPDGSDQAGEFIELYNSDTGPVCLAGWKITDGKRTVALPETSMIGAKKFLAFSYATTRLFLNNSGGTIKLIDPNGQVKSGVVYSKAESGQSFARTADLKQWQWTTTPTPGESNKFIDTNTESTADDTGSTGDSETKTTGTTGTATAKPADLSADELVDVPSRTLVRLSGTVVVVPGMYSVSSFWIVSNGLGVEVVSSTKAFPKLALGQQVIVVGRTSEAGIGLRINLLKDGVTGQSPKSDLQPLDAEIGELNEESIGQFVQVEGVISELKGQQFSITNDVGELVQIVFKRGAKLKTDSLFNGQRVTVTGLVGTGSGGIQIWPRVAEDIKPIISDASAEVLGDATKQQTNADAPLAVVTKKASMLWPAVAVAVLFLGAGIWLYVNWRKKMKEGQIKLGVE